MDLKKKKKKMVEALNILSIARKQVGFPYACIGISFHWSLVRNVSE